jgi:plasmid replication initiation protein
VVEPACAEVNQIAHFTVTYRIETGLRNKVTAIEFWFQLKDLSDVIAAEREREASKVGRRARRKGNVEATITVLDLPPRPDALT